MRCSRLSNLFIGLVAITAAALASAQTYLIPDIRHVGNADFASFKTYVCFKDAATTENPLLNDNPKLRGWIHDAVDAQLQAKGFNKVDYADADFTLAFQVRARTATVVTRHRYEGWKHGSDRSKLPQAQNVMKIADMTEGTLIIDVVDPDRGDVVWMGRIYATVENPGKSNSRLEEAVAKLMQRFPPLLAR